MPVGVLLTLAIAAEVAATDLAALLRRLHQARSPSAIVVVGYATSFCLLSLILKRALRRHDLRDLGRRRDRRDRASIGIVALGEPADGAAKLASIALIIAGVIGLEPVRGAHSMSRGPSRHAQQLLDAAIAVIRRDGAQALTLDAVAAEAGVSKGGVLYHFATKRALIDGLIERWLDDFEAQLDAARPRARPTCTRPT